MENLIYCAVQNKSMIIVIFKVFQIALYALAARAPTRLTHH